MLTLGLLHPVLHPPQGATFDYVGVALAAFASWVGVPGPGEPVLIAAGIFAARHKLDISPVLVDAWVGATLGGIVGWLIGMFAGRTVLTARGPFRSARVRAVQRGEQVFKRVEVLAIWLTPSWVAGINRADTGVYLVTNAVGAALWACGIGLGAYYIGAPIADLLNDAGAVVTAVAVLAVLVGVTVVLIRRRRRRAARAGPEQAGESAIDGQGDRPSGIRRRSLGPPGG